MRIKNEFCFIDFYPNSYCHQSDASSCDRAIAIGCCGVCCNSRNTQQWMHVHRPVLAHQPAICMHLYVYMLRINESVLPLTGGHRISPNLIFLSVLLGRNILHATRMHGTVPIRTANKLVANHMHTQFKSRSVGFYSSNCILV